MGQTQSLADPFTMSYQNAGHSETGKARVAADPTLTPRPAGLICAGLPDDAAISVFLDASHAPSFHFPNLLELPQAARTRLESRNAIKWFPLAQRHDGAPPGSAVNMCAHLDAYSKALTAIDDLVGTGLPVFNHPRAVAMARRDVASALLREVEGLGIPKLVHFAARQPEAFEAAFAAGKFRYPVEVQPTTARDRQDRMGITGPEDWSRLLVGDWSRRHYFMTQLARQPVADALRLRVCIVGNTWTARAYRDNGVAPDRPDGLDVTLRKAAVGAMRQLPLDFWSLDLRLRPDGKLALQDVSVGMTAPAPGRGLDPMRQASIELWARAGPQLDELIAAPARWRPAPPDAFALRTILTRFGGRQPADMGERVLH